MKDLKKDFPILNNYTYLNTASSGLISKPLFDWRRQQDLSLMEQSSIFRDQHKTHIECIRSSAARFFGASESEVALIPNFSFGFNTLLEGLPKNQKVLLLKMDYPSVTWPLENRDFDVCYAEIDENLEQNVEDAIAQHQPDIFAFSIVQYVSGIKMDLSFIKRLKAYHPELLIVADGTQFLGTSEFDFSESGMDVLGASTYKWMLSGYGNGLFFVKEEAQKRIFPKTIGFNSADAVFSKRDSFSFVKHFEPGHQDTLNYGSIEQSILYFEAIGMEVVSEKIKTLSEKARVAFTALGLLDSSVVNRKEHSNIFNIKGDEKLFQKLKENKIICSLRGDGIRVGFHFYNTEEDLEKLLSVLA